MRADCWLAIMQPYFFPYLGYFQLMAEVDTFVIYDDVNFINRGWINRNQINLSGEAHLFTVPLKRASQNRLICEIDLADDPTWRDKMVRTIRQAYVRSPQFERIFPLIEQIVQYPAHNLGDYLRHSLTTIRDHLGLATQFVATSKLYGNDELKAQARIIDICRRERAHTYINAIGGRELYNRDDFELHDIQLRFLRPSLPRYAQAAKEFIPGLSIIDVLMCNDPATVAHMLKRGTLS